MTSALEGNEKTGPDPGRTLPKIAYIHIPKCAGTSLVQAIRDHYPAEKSSSFHFVPAYWALRSQRQDWNREDWQTEWMRIRQYHFAFFLQQGKPFVYGHMPVTTQLLEQFQKEYLFFTVLRDPVERFISNYVYDKTGGGVKIPDVLPKEQSTISAELDYFLKTRDAFWLARDQLIMLAGLPFGATLSDADLLERAQKNLDRIPLVGFSNQLDTFSSGFKQHTGLELTIPQTNRTEQWIARKGDSRADYYSAFTDPVKETIRELCKAEYFFLNTITGKESS